MSESPIRVVVVEDNYPLRELTKEILERSDKFRVVGEAANGDEALRECLAHVPELVLLDLRMPGRDGFSVLPELRRNLPFAKVVAYTMLPRIPNEQRVRSLGGDGYIEKNVESSEFIEELQRLVRSNPSVNGQARQGH